MIRTSEFAIWFWDKSDEICDGNNFMMAVIGFSSVPIFAIISAIEIMFYIICGIFIIPLWLFKAAKYIWREHEKKTKK